MPIYVECNPDEYVVKHLLGFKKKEIKHASGKPRIGKLLQKNENCVALVDEDPESSSIPYFDSLSNTKKQHEISFLRSHG